MSSNVTSKQASLALLPVHLRGAEKIGESFGVHRKTVVQWYQLGAPIALVGGVYMTEYSLLMHWLVQEYSLQRT